ncbi:MAG: hypothetical protein ACK5L5_02425 [Bacteroidales bacterium]
MTKLINTICICITLITLFNCVEEEGHTLILPPSPDTDWADTLLDKRYIVSKNINKTASLEELEWVLLQRSAIVTPKIDMMLTSPYLPWTGSITINGVNYKANTFSYDKQRLANFFTISNNIASIKVFDDHLEVHAPSYFDQTGTFLYDKDSLKLQASTVGFTIDIKAPTKTLLAKKKYRFAETRTPVNKVNTILFKTTPDSVALGKGSTIIGVNWVFSSLFSVAPPDKLTVRIKESEPNTYIGNIYSYDYHLTKDKVAGDGIINGLMLYEEKNIMGIVARTLYADIGFEDYEVRKVEIEHEYYHR